MRPARIADELAQEGGRVQRAADGLRVVLAQVGDLGAADLRAHLLGERQRPHRLADALGDLGDQLAQGVVVRQHPGRTLAKPDDAGAGEGGDVDEEIGLLLGRDDESVGEDEAAFGIGVVHLDGRTAADRQHVARSGRRATDHVLGHRSDAGDAHR